MEDDLKIWSQKTIANAIFGRTMVHQHLNGKIDSAQLLMTIKFKKGGTVELKYVDSSGTICLGQSRRSEIEVLLNGGAVNNWKLV